jgi:hypothetical protein
VCRADVLGLDACVEAPPVIDRDAGLRIFGDGGILRLFDGGIGELFDGGGRRRIRDAGRD